MTEHRRYFVKGAQRVTERLNEAGWRPTTRWDWDLYWRPQLPSLSAYASLRPGMRVNHLPGIGALTSPRLLPATLANVGRRDDLWPDGDAAITASRFVLIAGVDPLRVYVYAAGEGTEPTAAVEHELRRIIVTAILAARDPITCAVRDVVKDREACFELLRFDFRVEGDRAWLLRCALSPSLDAHPSIAADTLSLLGILPGDHETRFHRLVPSSDPSKLFAELPLPRFSDLVLAEELSPGAALTVDERFEFRAVGAFLAGKLVLYCEDTVRFYVPNDTAAYVWLRLEERTPLDTIAGDLHRQFSLPLATARSDVWDIVARWAHQGLLRRTHVPRAAAAEPPRIEPPGGGVTTHVRVLDRVWRIDLPAEMRVLAPLAHLHALDPERVHDAWISVTPEEAGFCLRSSEGDDAECRDRAEVFPLVRRWLASGSRPRSRNVAAIAGIAIALGERTIVLVGPESLGGAAIAAMLMARGAAPIASGVVLIDEETSEPHALALGLEVSELDERDVSAALPDFAALPWCTLPSELAARYVPFAAAPISRPVSALVFVRRSSSGDATSSLESLDCLSALQQLSAHGLSASPPMTNASAERFLAWLECTPCFELTMGGDLAAAVDRVELVFDEGGPHAR